MMATLSQEVHFWRERLGISLKERGLRGTLSRMLHYGRLYLSPTGWRERRFDRQFGVQTAGRIGHYELGVTSPTLRYSNEYRPTPVKDFVDILNDLPIEYEQSVFVDLGAGKGRAVLLASRFPFKEIVGVEFSADLTHIAQDNIRAYKDVKQRCDRLSVVCQDASEYVLPEDPIVIYLNNPFRDPVMSQVIKNIETSLSTTPRAVYIIYWNPFCAT